MTLNELFYIPNVFEPSDLTLWQDDYISSVLLSAHLNPHHDNASRNHHFIEESSKWLLSQITNVDSLLDLGCGPGLYTSKFSESINTVVGVDFSSRSIAYAKEHDSKTAYIEADYVDLELDRVFDTITMIHCEYGSLNPDNRKKLLETIKQSLKKEGQFFFDIFTPIELEQFEVAQRWTNQSQGFHSNRPYTEVILNKVYPNNISLRQSTVIQDDSLKVFRQWYQYFTLTTIQQELEQAGLTITEVYENFKGDPYNPYGKTLALMVSHI